MQRLGVSGLAPSPSVLFEEQRAPLEPESGRSRNGGNNAGKMQHSETYSKASAVLFSNRKTL
jgi:hypothetical protein